MDSTFNDRRDAIKQSSQKKIAQAHTADRQARDRARKQAKSKAGFEAFSADEQTQALVEAEDKVLGQRASKGQDIETKRAAILDEETALIFQINEEEKASQLKLLGEGFDKGKGKKRAREDNSKEEEFIKKAFNANMTPIIEKLERQIIAGGASVVPGVSQKELEDFTANASNPVDVVEYLEYWSGDGVDLDEGLTKSGEEYEDDDDDLEVVVSEDEEEDEDADDNEDLEDLIDDSEL